MAWNSLNHPYEAVYDSLMHEQSIEQFLSLSDWKARDLKGFFEGYPITYHYLIGKLTALTQTFFSENLHPFFISRLLFGGALLIFAGLYFFLLFPKLGVSKKESYFSLALMFFLLPGQHLAQVMFRNDILLFMAMHLMFFCWFYFEFPARLAGSRKYVCIWALLLVLMANSTPMAFFAVGLFFLWGIFLLLKDSLRKGRGLVSALPVLFFAFFLALACSSHYLLRYINTGEVLQSDRHEYMQAYHEKQKGFDRGPMFLNFEFDKLFHTPNRRASFSYDNNAFLPRFYGDIWADHWLYFSGQKGEDKKTQYKRFILLAALPFTLLYFAAAFFFAFRGVASLCRRQSLQFAEVAAVLFLSAFSLLLLFVYLEPEVGKNSTIKFIYLVAFQWFPFFCICWLVEKSNFLARVLPGYLLCLFLVCLPLYFF